MWEWIPETQGQGYVAGYTEFDYTVWVGGVPCLRTVEAISFALSWSSIIGIRWPNH